MKSLISKKSYGRKKNKEEQSGISIHLKRLRQIITSMNSLHTFRKTIFDTEKSMKYLIADAQPMSASNDKRISFS